MVMFCDTLSCSRLALAQILSFETASDCLWALLDRWRNAGD